jgi:uncharacterized protein YjiS (DUF1127 family)
VNTLTTNRLGKSGGLRNHAEAKWWRSAAFEQDGGAMPKITEPATVFGHAAAKPFRRAARAFVRLLIRNVIRFDRALRDRQALRVLARMDDRMLADIGLSRGDLQEAYAQSLWRDPGNLLRARALERRLAQLGISFGFGAGRPSAPPLAPQMDDMTASQAREVFCKSK